MKKILFTLLCATAMLAVEAQQRFGVEGFILDGLCYSITGANTVQVVSCKYMSNCPTYPSTVVIPETVAYEGTVYTVTRIDDYVFNGNTGIRNITLPPTIQEIGRYAFSSTSIQSVELPVALRIIDRYAFAYCSRLQSVHLPASLISIGPGAFYSTAIEAFSIDSANSIYCVVDGMLCTADTTVLVAYPPADVRSTITLPATLRRIEAWSIGGYPQSVILPDGLREIGEGAFPTTIDTLHLPATVCRIEGNPLGGNPPTTLSVTIGEGNSHYTFADGRLTSVDGDTLLLVVGASGDYIIPAGVKVLANGLFANCRTLTSVTLPDGLTDIGEGAFFSTRCDVNLPASLRTIGIQAFMRNSGMREVVIPAGVRTIEREAFSQSQVTSVTLPDSLRVIGREAFYLCMSLTDLQLGSCLEEVHPQAFYTTSLNALQPLPASLRTLGFAAFDGLLGEAEYVEFLGSPDTIGVRAFCMSEARFLEMTPPVIFEMAFWRASTVHVPCGSTAAYQAQPGLATASIEEDCGGIVEAGTTEVVVSPNPAGDRATVVSSFGLTAIEAYDPQGRQLYTAPATGLKAELDVSAWPRGTVLLHIHTPAGTTVKKLLLR